MEPAVLYFICKDYEPCEAWILKRSVRDAMNIIIQCFDIACVNADESEIIMLYNIGDKYNVENQKNHDEFYNRRMQINPVILSLKQFDRENPKLWADYRLELTGINPLLHCIDKNNILALKYIIKLCANKEIDISIMLSNVIYNCINNDKILVLNFLLKALPYNFNEDYNPYCYNQHCHKINKKIDSPDYINICSQYICTRNIYNEIKNTHDPNIHYKWKAIFIINITTVFNSCIRNEILNNEQLYSMELLYLLRKASLKANKPLPFPELINKKIFI